MPFVSTELTKIRNDNWIFRNKQAIISHKSRSEFLTNCFRYQIFFKVQIRSVNSSSLYYRPRTYVRREVMFSQVCVCSGGVGYPVSVKGKFFDTRFGLIHVQAGEKFFCRGTPLPPVKGKIFDTRFGLIHVQTGKFFFVKGPPPWNSKKLLWLRGGRFASCVHAGGLSCL